MTFLLLQAGCHGDMTSRYLSHVIIRGPVWLKLNLLIPRQAFYIILCYSVVTIMI